MSEKAERYRDTIIPAAPGTFVWIATNERKGADDVWPRMYRVPVIGWRAVRDSYHAIPILAGTELAEDAPFLLESPDGPVSIGTIEAGWHTECPSLEAAIEAAGFADAR